MKRRAPVCGGLVLALVLAGSGVPTARAQELDLSGFRWRALGPAAMSGRVVDIAVDPADPATFYVAAASGGLWKTTNRGTTFVPVFDEQPVQSIGDVAVAPSDPSVVWVGTGEANNQRSSYWGDGVYKSTDGGETWTNMGLPESHHIGRIAIHPEDPGVVFVAALGHLYTPNPERGLYRTEDGGRTWEAVLQVDADTGVVDVALEPGNPRRVFAASYQRRRRAWNFDAGGPGSGIWRSEDGGDTWKRLEGGLPEGELGRIGLCIHPRRTRILYACVENRNPAPDKPRAGPSGAAGEEAESGLDPGDHRWGVPEEEYEAAGGNDLVGGEVYRSDDGGDTWRRVNEKPVSGRPPYYYGQIRVDPLDPERVWLLGVRLFHSGDGGRSWDSDGAPRVHVDHHALWIDPEDRRHMLLGNDGGLAVSHDGGAHWDVFPNLPLAQFYAVAVDDREPYRIYGGTQDNGTWFTPSRGFQGEGIPLRAVLKVAGGDGFYAAADPEEPDVIYAESQFGRPVRLDLRTRRRKRIRPPRGHGSPEQRFNWMTPLMVSPHNPRTLYVCSQRVHRSRDRGDTWEVISPDLTTDDPLKTSGNVPHCTITTLSVSPLDPRVIWVGTDDGRVQLTQDGGRRWRDVAEGLDLAARGLWISRVSASAHERGRAYVAVTGYREDHFAPYVFVTEDYGGTFTGIVQGLPRSPVNDILEDRRNPDLLFAATEHGVHVSLDRGDRWRPLQGGMPAVAVHDLVVQDRRGDLVAGTHGRGIYVMDVSPLRHLTAERRAKPLHLGPLEVIPEAPPAFSRGRRGHRSFAAPQPEAGARIWWHLEEPPPEGPVVVEVRDAVGELVCRLEAPGEAGLGRVLWDLRSGRGEAERPGERVPAGEYVVLLEAGKHRERRVLRVPAPPEAAALGPLRPRDP